MYRRWARPGPGTGGCVPAARRSICTTCGPTSRSSPSTTSGQENHRPRPLGQLGAGHCAVAVAGNLNTYYEDIKSGVSNGVVTFATGAQGPRCMKWHPTSPRSTLAPQFAGGIAMNKGRFDKLPPEGRRSSARWATSTPHFRCCPEGRRRGPAEKNGRGRAKISELPAAERKRWADALPPWPKPGPPTADGRAGRTGAQRLCRGPEKAGADLPRDWSAK